MTNAIKEKDGITIETLDFLKKMQMIIKNTTSENDGVYIDASLLDNQKDSESFRKGVFIKGSISSGGLVVNSFSGVKKNDVVTLDYFVEDVSEAQRENLKRHFLRVPGVNKFKIE